MKEHAPNAILKGATLLYDYALYFKGSCDNYSYLTIEEEKGSYIPVGVFEIPASDIPLLDEYEDYPALYRKKYFDITLNNKQVKALAYVINPEYSYHLPSSHYVATCSKGYQDFGFDQQVIVNAILNTKNKMERPRT